VVFFFVFLKFIILFFYYLNPLQRTGIMLVYITDEGNYMKLVAAVDYQGKQEVQTYHEGVMELRGFAWLRWQHKKGWLIQVPYVGACMVSMKDTGDQLLSSRDVVGRPMIL
jgi:hypothetical protein